ncbi:MAG TPA: hypothetical protein VMX55_11870 [candidate division Zixibacteria bacterium]|nr:hypothetical protein [candidate division Zixibacteria bacterium]
MPLHLTAILERWITEFNLSAVRDIMLEFLAVIAFLFLLAVLIIAMIKAPILSKHGSIEMIIFVILGLIHATMNVFDEFAWFTQEFYDVWKTLKDLCLLVGAIILVIGFFRFFLFSTRLFGTEKIEESNVKIKEEEEFTSESDING